MTLVSVPLFSLVWGFAVWLVLVIVSSSPTVRVCSPGVWLSAVLAILVPCALVATGWTLPDPVSPGPVTTFGGAGDDLSEMTATVGRMVSPSQWQDNNWISWLIFPVYAAGLIVQLLKTMRGAGRLAGLRRDARPLQGFRAHWPLLVTAAKVAPFAVGGRRPMIILPELIIRDWPAARVSMVIDHEEAHLRHRDPDIAIVLGFVAALFWFNPFVRNLVGRWRHACELRADMVALRGATAADRKSYANALLDAMRIPAGSGSVPASSFTTHSMRNEKMRITAILQGFRSDGRGTRNVIAHCAVLSLVVMGSAGALATSSNSADSLGSFIAGGRVSSPYGVARPFRRDHTGIDVAAEIRTPIAAPDDALVLQATDLFRAEPKWGKAVVLQFEDGLVGWFTHLDSYWVKPGDTVAKGASFGSVGSTGDSTGPHVHVEVYRGTKRLDPATVWPFLRMSAR